MILLLTSISKSFAVNLNDLDLQKGVIALMYHRFNENKYPSTNIQMDIFKNQIDIIYNNNYKFYKPDKFETEFTFKKFRSRAVGKKI